MSYWVITTERDGSVFNLVMEIDGVVWNGEEDISWDIPIIALGWGGLS